MAMASYILGENVSMGCIDSRQAKCIFGMKFEDLGRGVDWRHTRNLVPSDVIPRNLVATERALAAEWNRRLFSILRCLFHPQLTLNMPFSDETKDRFNAAMG
jgi:hypothetical protein